MSWVAYLKIHDEIKNTKIDIKYEMKNVSKYRNLFYNLYKLTGNRYKMRQINFYLYYSGKCIFVDDWNKYILQRDKIIVKITNTPPIYTLHVSGLNLSNKSSIFSLSPPT